MGRASNKFIYGLIFALLLGGSFPSAQAASVPVANGSVVRDYARITFEWPRTVYFKAAANGKNLTVTFDHKANPDMGKLLRQLNPYITHVERKADGKTLIFSLDKPYRIRTFVSDNINGIDLLGVDPKARRKTAIAKVTTEAPMKAAKKEIKKPVSVSVVEYTAGEEQAEKLAALAPAAGEESTPAAEVPVENKAAEIPPDKQEAPTVASTLEAGDSTPIPPDELKEKMTGDPGKLKVNLSASLDSAVIRLPFTERVALAVFVRNRHLWLVLNKPMPLDLSDFEDMPRTVVGKAQWIKSLRATVLRMPIDDGVYVNIAKEEEHSLEWAILITPKKHTLEKPVQVIVNTEPPSPAHVFIPVLTAAEPVAITDPQIGDKMVVTPFYNLEEGIAKKREFVDFTLLQTAQGMAVVKKSDDVAVVPLRNGFRISMPKGATLTPGLPEVKDAQSSSSSIALATLFPYDLWKIESTTNHRLYTNALFHRIAASNNSQEANDARLRLAQYYLGQGMAVEALAYLDGINRTNPSFYRSSKLAALRGAANFLMTRYAEAARDFASSELNNNKEIDYWRNMLGDLLGNSEQSYNYLALNTDYFSKYPPMLRQRLAIVAADRSIAAREYNTALQIFDALHQDNQTENISAYINFLLAKVSADTGQEKDALEMWDKLAGDYKRPFVQSRAEFSRIIYGMEHDLITKDEAADRLERLRLNWHGDSLELQILTLLGEIYSEKKDYLNAMRIWHGAIQSFPNTAISIDMTRKMQEAFIGMFNEGGSDMLPPIEALALYYEYRTYTPPGNTGDEMMERLADRLVSVDLLDQAATLLDHQMKFQVEKERRSKVGAKLATIYLLNRQPKKALQALQDSVYGENSLLLKLYRNRLTAEAMMALGQSDKALQTLGQDNSADAEKIRLDVYWHERDWTKVINSVEATLKLRTDSSAPITLDESEMLLKLSLAYVFQNDLKQLQYLRDYYGPLMASNPNKEVFDFITSPDMKLTTRNFDELVLSLTKTRTFIDTYKARIETADLGAAKPQVQ